MAIDAGQIYGTVLVTSTGWFSRLLSCITSESWVAFVSRGALAHSTVVLGSASGTTGTAGIHTWVYTLPVTTSMILWTVSISPALECFALDVWVTLKASWAATSSFMVDREAFSSNGTWVFEVAWVNALSVAALACWWAAFIEVTAPW